MAINPFSKPAGGSGQGGANLVPMRPEQPGLPVRQIAQAAQNFQKRRNAVKDEMDQAFTTMAETATTPKNRQTFKAMTRPVREQLNQIAESNELVNKKEEVRKLANQMTKKAEYFKQNQDNLEKSLENLRDVEMTPRHRQAAERELQAQANIEVGEDGSVVSQGLSQPRHYGEMNTPYDIVDDLDFGKVVRDVREQMPDGQVRKMKKKGVFGERVRREAARRLGLAEDAPMDPGLANWMQMEGKAIRANNPEIGRDELNARVRAKFETAIRSAEDRYIEEGRAYDPSGGDSGGSSEEGDGLFMYPGNTKGADVDSFDRTGASQATQEELKYVVDTKKKAIREQSRQKFGIESGVYDEIKNKRSELERTSPDNSPGPMSPGDLRGDKSLRSWVIENHGESTWESYKWMEEEMQKAESASVNDWFIGVDSAKKSNKLEKRILAAMPSSEKLTIPGAEGGSVPGWSNDRAEERAQLMKDAQLVGIGSEGRILQMRYQGDGTTNFAPNDRFTVRMPQGIEEALLNEEDSEILGDRLQTIIKQNKAAGDIAPTGEWTNAGEGVELRLNMNAELGRSGAKSASPQYEVRGGGTRGTYGRVLQAVKNSDDPPKRKQEYLDLLTNVAMRDPNMEASTIHTALRDGIDNMPDDLREQLQDAPITLKNKGVAIEWGQRLKKIN